MQTQSLIYNSNQIINTANTVLKCVINLKILNNDNQDMQCCN
jgi:hypothetical protein